MCHEVVQRDCITAGRANLVDVDDDYCTRAWLARLGRDQRIVFGSPVFVNGTSNDAQHDRRVQGQDGVKFGGDLPIPKSLRILGGPSKAENMTVIRPFSRMCEIVSTPLPLRSSYQTCFELTTWKHSAVPLGETLMWPWLLRGAEATQNMCCFWIHSKSHSGISS